MSLFLVALAGLIALALVFVLPPLLRASQFSGALVAANSARRSNLHVLREQLAALEAEHVNGALDVEQYRTARIEIESRALEEEQDLAAPAVAAPAGKTVVFLGAFVPLFAFVMYGALGTPEVMLAHVPGAQQAAAEPAGNGEMTQAQIEGMVSKLANRLENQTSPQPGDDNAWAMLGRSYAVMQRFPEANKAFVRARSLAPDNPQLMADHADVLAMLQGRSVVGEPAKLAERALQIDPRNLKALALSGSAAFERKDYDGALKFWTAAKQMAEPGSQFAAGLDNSIQQAQAASSKAQAAAGPAMNLAQVPPANSAKPAPVAPPPAGVPATVATFGAKVSGIVQLAGPLASRAAPGDTVFVFARAAQGPRMPLAILRKRVSDLPLTFTLDDSTAMQPEMSLSRFSSVIVGARISRSGDAMPRSGDLVGQVGPVDIGAGRMVITIDGVQP
ncbi:MAG: c-type cytochrome biogenesis protein CcmI [Rhodoferax sp.]|nr:c-type cytochrome biogenesis protein CcmI [Rhodoferax sp.]